MMREPCKRELLKLFMLCTSHNTCKNGQNCEFISNL